MPSPTETVEVAFITPRHLAGGGDPAWVTRPLHLACGWRYDGDPLLPRVILSSPDQKAVLRLEPGVEGPWWTLHHAADRDRPAWSASFGACAPVELIAAFMDALTAPEPDAPWDPYGALRQAGWSRYFDNGLVSPDNKAYIERLGTPAAPTWGITVSLGLQPKAWEARFGAHTPPHLVAAFTTALADREPVHRIGRGSSLPTPLDPSLVSRRTTSVLAVYIDGALEHRVRSLASRRGDSLLGDGRPPDLPPPHHGRSR
ncbi:DUF317 domain-containing protein [Streptomyces sp. NPDC026589]|uniref:DUF317 domain-containing protein n=1 Tax=Streptomyces sp. NPDC026589 TaxID=3155609 RepID=UPI003401711C